MPSFSPPPLAFWLLTTFADVNAKYGTAIQIGTFIGGVILLGPVKAVAAEAITVGIDHLVGDDLNAAVNSSIQATADKLRQYDHSLSQEQ
ncbi:MAG TPA: hypothetical protein VF194_09310 [Ferrovibrio sp.]|jgi:hypothetical protein|uniref:hypothetical protein n=1 Tax=Ferrovibrio sp. TaxID=1917215 RepID=UPI002ED41808